MSGGENMPKWLKQKKKKKEKLVQHWGPVPFL